MFPSVIDLRGGPEDGRQIVEEGPLRPEIPNYDNRFDWIVRYVDGSWYACDWWPPNRTTSHAFLNYSPRHIPPIGQSQIQCVWQGAPYEMDTVWTMRHLKTYVKEMARYVLFCERSREDYDRLLKDAGHLTNIGRQWPYDDAAEVVDDAWFNASVVLHSLGIELPDTFGDLTDLRWGIHSREWLFPDDPFVTYEDHDELWARPIRYGVERRHLEQK